MIKFGGQKLDPPQIVNYPSYGFRTPHGEWRINFAGLAYQTPPINLRQKMLIKMLAGMMKADEDAIQSQNFQNRIGPFFVEADKGYRIQIQIGDRQFQLKKKTKRNGRFSSWLRLSDEFCREQLELDACGRPILKYQLLVDHHRWQPIESSVRLLSPKGISVISDIDDTIKESVSYTHLTLPTKA